MPARLDSDPRAGAELDDRAGLDRQRNAAGNRQLRRDLVGERVKPGLARGERAAERRDLVADLGVLIVKEGPAALDRDAAPVARHGQRGAAVHVGVAAVRVVFQGREDDGGGRRGPGGVERAAALDGDPRPVDELDDRAGWTVTVTPDGIVTLPPTRLTWALVQVSFVAIVPEYQAAVLLIATCCWHCPTSLPEASCITACNSYWPSGTPVVFQLYELVKG